MRYFLEYNWPGNVRELQNILKRALTTAKGNVIKKHDLPLELREVVDMESEPFLEEEVKPGQPRRFYMRAAYVLSPLPVKLAERLEEKGLKLPEYIMNWYHSVTQ